MELVSSQHLLLELIEEALGYRVSETILKHEGLIDFIFATRFNKPDTIKYNALLQVYTSVSKFEKDEDLENEEDEESCCIERAFDELTINRTISELPVHIGFANESLDFSIMTTQWADEYGAHILLKIIGKEKSSNIVIFDVDNISQEYYSVN